MFTSHSRMPGNVSTFGLLRRRQHARRTAWLHAVPPTVSPQSLSTSRRLEQPPKTQASHCHRRATCTVQQVHALVHLTRSPPFPAAACVGGRCSSHRRAVQSAMSTAGDELRCASCDQPLAGSGPVLLTRADTGRVYVHQYGCPPEKAAPSSARQSRSDPPTPQEVSRPPDAPTAAGQAPTHCDPCGQPLRREATLLLCPWCDPVTRHGTVPTREPVASRRVTPAREPVAPRPVVPPREDRPPQQEQAKRRTGRTRRAGQVYDGPVDSGTHRRISQILNEREDYL
jgi:uncharacterized Zn finger protein (UPF0148 family)